MEQTTTQLAVNQQQEFPLAVLKKDELYVKSSQQNKVEITKTIEEAFTGFEEIEKQVKSIEVKGIDDKMNIELADTYRKNIKQTRLKYEKIFDAKRQEIKALKSEYDLQDKMWLKAKQLIGEKFKAVEEIAKFKADFVERFQAEQKALRTQKRINEVSKYIEPNPSVFENMNDTNFGFYLQGLKSEHEKQIQAEQKAETERIAKEKTDAEAREKQRIENEKLKVQVEAEREAKAKLEAELKAKEYAELRAKKEAQVKAELEREAAEQKAQEPIEKQLLDWIDSFQLPALEVESEHKEVILNKFEYFKRWAKAQAKKDIDSLRESVLIDINNMVQNKIKKLESDNEKQEEEGSLLTRIRACKTMTELENLRNKAMEQNNTNEPAEKTTRTQEEIRERFDKAKDFLDVQKKDLLEFMEFETAKDLLNKEYVKQVEAGEEIWEVENAKEKIMDYLPFAYEKAENERGISAARSMLHFKTWIWIDNAEFYDEILPMLKDYTNYGIPTLNRIAEKYGYIKE
ncbi:hypothetical protein ACE193_21275 [Bernardetia sp. OM2101]|uniref:hypothetical protein n=1 Tax=Bernardetia sp. OM2101 TaxID=3344876 RepID=UPI0035D04D5D